MSSIPFFQNIDVSHRRYMSIASTIDNSTDLTCLLLLTLCSFQSPTRVQELAFDPAFIESIGHYLGAADHAVRRCGMLAAEVVATKAGKKLDFGEWEGDEPGKQWARELRALIQTRDIDVIIHSDVEEATSSAPVPATVEEDSDDEEPPPHPSAKSRPSALNSNHGCDSDDSLTGYASSSSSRSPSPTPSELEEIEKDPTLAVGVKKIARPVYLAQLGELLRPTTISQGDDPNEADRLEMGLGCAEELIRRKRAYGSELAENAVNLVHALLALNNNFDLDNFDERRQAGLTALVACCPTRAAPSIVEEFFRNQYSGEQRAAMLNALALGARELAGLPVPASSVDPGRIAFPSKRLPPALERRYIAAMDHVTAHPPVHGLLEDITRGVIAKTTAPGGSEPPQIARERQLQIRPLAKVVPLPAPVASQTLFQAPTPTQAPQTTFGSVAAEYFVYPLIARFWTFLRDEQTREARTAALPPAHQYRSAGTGLLLSAPVLAQFVATLGVLLHAARLSPAWGAVLAPQAMELALAIGARRISLLDGEEDAREGSDTQVQSAHALVGAAALELALIVLDGSVDLDAGRALALEHTALLRGVGDWATSIFSSLEKGERAKGGGGALEIRLVRAAAGVCVKVEEVGQRWGRSMIQM
jgi:telomere length regulation protein